jgi:hypothetical protein
MSSINFRHGVVRPHEHARAAVLESGARSQLLRMAAVMPDAPIRCASSIASASRRASVPTSARRRCETRTGPRFRPLARRVEATQLDDVRAVWGRQCHRR